MARAALLCLYLLLGVPSSLLAQVRELPDFTDLAEKQGPTVVNISTTQMRERRSGQGPNIEEDDPLYDFFRRFIPRPPGPGQPPRELESRSLGSGFIISADGFILTNAHVVDAADEITVRLTDKREFKARVIGADRRTDLAVIKIDATGLPAAGMGNSDSTRVGEWVLAIGNPMGEQFAFTVTAGIVSAKGRGQLGVSTFENFIQTDAAINLGNSGGALVNAEGKLVGLNSAIAGRQAGIEGIGFAIPVSTAKMVLESIVKTGSVTRGWIGVGLQPITPALAEAFKLGALEGVVINEVLRSGPADKAGVKLGDVLLEVEGQRVTDPQSVLNVVAALAPGSPAKLKIKRKDQDLELAVTVGRRPKAPARE